MGGISGWQLLILLLIVVLVFGTKRLRTLGSDLGAAIKGFRSSMQGEEPGAEGEQDGEAKLDDNSTDSATATAQQKEKVEPGQS